MSDADVELGPPDDLTGEWADQWREVHERLVEQSTWAPTDRVILDRLIRNRRDVAEFRKRLAQVDPLVELYRDGAVYKVDPHPLIKMVRDGERDISRDEEALVLQPRTRIQRRVRHSVEREVGLDDALGSDP